ncbi:predicted protein [Uncinocarpus reesii 1704]|uniref:Skg3/CAF120-like PH-like domain-containing protein n=1 Tax=Uncinocarpus reesii (strain UAMH 1704) TaxID=336963 RepID=C4JVS7_UNCRE|nr:uncharacterized protein UREG_06669 [Uncinocarpus reesii 1704]EEP81804.1 predicted protein [Uncinocarpus reesii 1704]
MGRFRVLSFISSRRGSKNHPSAPPTPPSDASDSPVKASSNAFQTPLPQGIPAPVPDTTPPSTRPGRANSRAFSALFQPSQTPDSEGESVPELDPIFSYLNNQSGKLYYEGYFFKLNDLDNEGRQCPDRRWTEYFAQLVGTVLSLWDPAALEAAGPDGDVRPTFINVADASIRMQSRLTIYENTLLQESYTGALIAGKGKSINNMKTILAKTVFKHEDWVRVRFGPGTPWRRCWCVVSQADEKEVQKQKKMQKKKSAYDRSLRPPKGNIKFYTSKKKKAKPIATITDAFSAFAIYPQSRTLVNQSTLVKVEGHITIHTQPETSAEGFVFVLPELHAAVSGFETMLQWLFPVFDAFQLYGRPTRLLADTVSTRSLMFAMPSNRRNGYLDTLDVAALIHTEGSRNWSEREWRQQLKDATARRMTSSNNSRVSSISGRRGPTRASLPTHNGPSLRFEGANGQSSARRLLNNHSSDALGLPSQQYNQGSAGPQDHLKSHARTASENAATGNRNGYMQNSQQRNFDMRLPEETVDEVSPQPPPHGIPQLDGAGDGYMSAGRSSSGSETRADHVAERQEIGDGLKPSPLPVDLTVPPEFSHDPQDKPHIQPKMSPELRRAGSRISHGTYFQMMSASHSQEFEASIATGQNEKRQSMSFDPSKINEGYGDVSPEKTAFDGNPQFPKPLAADASSSHYSSPTSPVNSALDGSQFSAPLDSTHANFSRNPPRQSPQKRLQVDTNLSIPRKPVPPVQDGSQSPGARTISSLGSLRQAIDIEALNRVMTRVRTPSPPPPPQRRCIVDVESVHEPSPATTPDYASTISNRSTQSATKPRMGRMKVVGTPEPTLNDVIIGDTYYKAGSVAEPNPDIPQVDFGPTLTYSPTTRRPSTGDTLARLTGHKKSPEPMGKTDKRATWFGMENKPAMSPNTDEKRRSLLWQPGMVDSGYNNTGSGLTPEQFVEQRASNQAISPIYPHHQNTSRPSLQSRPVSGDWANQSRPQSIYQLPPRPNSRGSTIMLNQSQQSVYQLPPRPNSRGSTTMLNQLPPRPNSRGSGIMLNQPDISPHLSAREQEHVARMTGSSFFNMDKESSKRSSVIGLGSGLVSAIDAREREKQAIKEGVSGQMVQQAIAQRQYSGQYQPQPQMLQSSASQYQLPINQYPVETTSTSVYNFPTRPNLGSRYHRYSKSQDHLQYM